MGRVHLVGLGPDVGDQHPTHFLSQLDADANMGAQNLRERSRKGPFRSSKGRSRVMNRTAHVTYRRRRNQSPSGAASLITKCLRSSERSVPTG